jgi:hypothetical protein
MQASCIVTVEAQDEKLSSLGWDAPPYIHQGIGFTWQIP